MTPCYSRHDIESFKTSLCTCPMSSKRSCAQMSLNTSTRCHSRHAAHIPRDKSAWHMVTWIMRCGEDESSLGTDQVSFFKFRPQTTPATARQALSKCPPEKQDHRREHYKQIVLCPRVFHHHTIAPPKPDAHCTHMRTQH